MFTEITALCRAGLGLREAIAVAHTHETWAYLYMLYLLDTIEEGT